MTSTLLIPEIPDTTSPIMSCSIAFMSEMISSHVSGWILILYTTGFFGSRHSLCMNATLLASYVLLKMADISCVPMFLSFNSVESSSTRKIQFTSVMS